MAEENYEEIRKRIQKRYDDRAGFFIDLVCFLVFNVGIWIAWLATPEAARAPIIFPALVVTTLGWGIGVLAHMINYVNGEARERAIEEAIERERAWRDGSLLEKPKRDQRVRLSDEGELVEVVEEDEADNYKPLKRRQ
ncbi:MAG TPA: 2TM domain-containing protein [Phototrophicaceae bacterium]|nr:2TM domain-containing protein [Phototrophicaceae bacterium]